MIPLPSGRTKTLFLLRGEWLSAAMLARRAGLAPHIVLRRLRRQWTVEDAIEAEPDTIRRRAQARGVSERALRAEYVANLDAPSPPATGKRRGRPARSVQIGGESLPLHVWATRLGVTRSALYGLAERRGTSIERVIEMRLRAQAPVNDNETPRSTPQPAPPAMIMGSREHRWSGDAPSAAGARQQHLVDVVGRG